MNQAEWLSNEELFEEYSRVSDSYYCHESGEYIAKVVEEFERRLKLSGFFEMPLEFYLRELDGRIVNVESGFECRAFSRVFFGKTALEAAKAAYEWKNQQK